MLVDKSKTHRVEIPHEPGQWVALSYLTGVELDKAKDSNTQEQLTKYKPFLKEIQEIRTASAEFAEDKPENYDSFSLIRFALQAWSYEEPVTDSNIEALDAATRNWLVSHIWEENKPRPLGSSTS